MSVLARAEQLSDLSEVAYECAECFCQARCAGLDIKAIAAVAKAALRLGADQAAVYQDTEPHAADADYLDQLAALRIRLQQIIAEAAQVHQEAQKQALMAYRMLRAARNEQTRAMALQLLAEARAAMDLADETAMACGGAARLLLVAEADFRTTYEQTETTVAAGHQLPHDGRWITGDSPAANTPARV